MEHSTLVNYQITICELKNRPVYLMAHDTE